MTEERKLVLQMLEAGRVTVDEAERLLAALREAPVAGPSAGTGGRWNWNWEYSSGTRSGEAETGHRGGIELEETFESTAPLPPGGRIRLADAHGGASIRGEDVAEVQIRVLKRVRAGDTDMARRLLDSFQIYVTEENGDLVLRSSRSKPASNGFRERGRGTWAFYELVVPRQASLALGFQHGNVSVESVTGAVHLSGAHGQWEGRALGGPVQLRHEHGAVRLAELGSSLEARKAHGTLEVDGVAGDLRLDSEHGHRTLRGIGGRAEIRHAHGSMEVETAGRGLHLAAEHSRVRVQFTAPLAGDVAMRLEHCRASVALAAGSSARLNLAAQHGRLDAPAATIVERGRHSVRAQGTLGTGDHAFVVQSCHSSLSLITEEAPAAQPEPTPEPEPAVEAEPAVEQRLQSLPESDAEEPPAER